MRPLLATLLLAALSAPPATAGEVTVDPFLQTVETSRLELAFDFDRPEFLRTVVFKDYHPFRDIAGEDGRGREFWGQTRRGVDSTGFVLNDQLESHQWEVLESFGPGARVRIWSQSPDQPPVTTTYVFHADQPWFVVERTIHFSQRPDSAAYQAYAARVSFLNSYRALRWRDVTGAYLQRGYCFGGCETPSWDGRWLYAFQIVAVLLAKTMANRARASLCRAARSQWRSLPPVDSGGTRTDRAIRAPSARSKIRLVARMSIPRRKAGQ